MNKAASFQDILNEKMGTPSSPSEGSFFHPTSYYQDPAYLAFLLGKIDKTTVLRPFNKSYPQQPKPAPRPHVLTEAQAAARDFFQFHGAELGPAFTRKELKTAFRHLALRLHPDMNKGACGPFIDLKQNYETLLVVFN